ncbi:MAG TPA: lyase family protein, partial [Bacillota bacterium]|nr:lyase family protein [Bacillota bacterium]
AVPITFGFAVVQYVSRLGERIKLVEKTARNLRGKFAGAVGAYNASSLFFDDPETFEKEVLEEVGLLPSETSTQVVQPEYLTDFIHAITSTFGVLANLADDFRHLQRTEISEVGEYFAKDQVGSSTMPHKRNPWNFEHVKSLWKEFAPRIITMYMDQISEHQRDLTNSASQRFLVEMVAGLVLAAKRLTKVLGKLAVDRKRMRENFESTSQMVIAEPLYILLATAGHPDAHECVRKLTLKAEQEGKQLPELVASSEELEPYLSKLTAQQKEILISPETYLGASVRKVETICQRWEQYLDQRGEENA